MATSVITVTSSKGGVGKTSFATSLAHVYGRLGIKTLVIDLDLGFGGVALSMGVAPVKTIEDIITAKSSIAENVDLKSFTLETDSRFDIVAAPKSPLSAQKITQKHVSDIIKSYKELYEVIILDTTHTLTTSKVAALDNSDVVVHLTASTPTSIKNTRVMLEVANQINKKFSFSVVKYDATRPITPEYDLTSLEALLECDVDADFGKACFAKDFATVNSLGKTIFESTNNYNYKSKILTYAQNLIGIELSVELKK